MNTCGRKGKPAKPKPKAAVLLAVFLTVAATATLCRAQSRDDCLACHSDRDLKAQNGKAVSVNEDGFVRSVHGDLECVDCHSQPGNYEDVPHFAVYRSVACSDCHEDAGGSYNGSFHEIASRQGESNAPTCSSCHGIDGNPHMVKPLTQRTAESACSRCHADEARSYDGSVHAAAAAQEKPSEASGASPGCTGCHPTHSAAYPPSAGAVNKLCDACHRGAMQAVRLSGHMGEEAVGGGVISCASCHDVHATHKPSVDTKTLRACNTCHPQLEEQFKGSVHERLMESKQLNCLSCHRTHQVSDASESEDFGCGRCHQREEQEYRASAHRLARLRGDRVAATCADCHHGHHVLPAADPESPTNHFRIPTTCGECHSDQSVITADFVRLPISLPSYERSIHGEGWKKGKRTAVCSDCHGTHLLQSASSPTSTINKQNLAVTCGACHGAVSREYTESVHGRAVALGITDSPSCTDCHDEHLILAANDPMSSVFRGNEPRTCGQCHQDPEMAARYGLPPDVIGSYQDSYHGWAIKRGGRDVAVCADCHNTHAIGSRFDPGSSIHPNNVVETCRRCHENSNPKFAASYTHVLARNKRMIHDYVRIIYIVLISLVLGGMVVHNAVLFGHDLRRHYRSTKSEPTVVRMTPNEVWQHLVLTVTFAGLAITGFALRFPESWWAGLLSDCGLSEGSRRIVHRVLGMMLVVASVYHVFYLLLTRRGRRMLRALVPGMRDAADAAANVRYHIGLGGDHPTFGTFDYTQKAEYWALIWGTIVMALTGFVLMFPDVVTGHMPAWVVRVSETIHFYEAILAVGAILIWHFYFTIFQPREYPMSWTWITGRMPESMWRSHHARESAEKQSEPEEAPGNAS